MNRILVLGGTSFVGRNLVELLLAEKKSNIYLFNRGSTNPYLFPELNLIQGDRNDPKQLKQVFARKWDFVIDVSCYYPEQLRLVLDGINLDLTRYVFISTCSVYDSSIEQRSCRNETAPILGCSPQQGIDKSNSTYGNRKAECERILKDSGFAFTILRPALVYGPYDPTDRFYYWLYQVKTQESVLLPEKGKRVFSMTYVKDLAQSIVESLNHNSTNQTFNCISHTQISIAEILGETETVMGRKLNKVDTSALFLQEKGIDQWFGIPLWLNTDSFTFSNKHLMKELNVNLTSFRDGLNETIDYFNRLGYTKPSYGIDDLHKNNLIKELISS